MQINFNTGKEYTGQNQITLTGKYRSNEWGTYLQWTAAGVRVKKGQKGTRIIKIVNYTDAKGKENRAPRFYTVFNREQVEPVMQLVNTGRLMAVR